MIRLETGATVIATDSGGVQKEALFHRVPCVTLRDETEWVESVELGWNRLCPPVAPDRVATAILAARGTKGRPDHPYGEGRAAELIAASLADEGP
jgi:UDP-GlcNAc3NAcA epimerase